jgi:KamA family protein
MQNQRSEELTKKAEKFCNFKNNYFKENNSKNKYIQLFPNVNPDDWQSYTWQLKNRFNNICEINKIFNTDLDLKLNDYLWAVTPHFLSLIKEGNYGDPIFSQIIPSNMESIDNWGDLDPMDEINTQPVNRITRRYPDRIIINVTNMCFSYCRYCQRKRNFSNRINVISDNELSVVINYIKTHHEIRDVLITGGDPLTLNDSYLMKIISKLREIKHIEIIRIGTRALSFLPQRITDAFVKKLKRYKPLYINTQFNHPNEISRETEFACNLLVDNGIVLGNQSVLLKGINDNTFTLQLLNQLLVKNRIRPYYIFHPKHINGTHHFYVSINRGIDIVSRLRGNTSGLCIPTYVINTPGGFGKVPLYKNCISINNNNTAILNTWENKLIKIHDDYEL